jgi:hypothetical protein
MWKCGGGTSLYCAGQQDSRSLEPGGAIYRIG